MNYVIYFKSYLLLDHNIKKASLKRGFFYLKFIMLQKDDATQLFLHDLDLLKQYQLGIQLIAQYA